MGNEIKIRLLKLGKKQVDLLAEIRKRGYSKICASSLSRYINGVDITPHGMAVKELIYQLLDEWEHGNKTA